MTCIPNRQNPRTLALRYRAYCTSSAQGGHLTMADLAAQLDVPLSRLRRALQGEKWSAALRTGTTDVVEHPDFQGSAAFEARAEAQAFVGVAA